MFYGVVSEEVDCCVGGGWFAVYVIFSVCLLMCYCQIKNIYTHIVFICGIELHVIMYLVYVCIDGVWVSSYCVAYDWDDIYVSCV